MASALISSAALAQQPSGSAVKVNRITLADGPGGERPLITEGAVYSGDLITTDPNGIAQIEFVDQTRIVVGPNSSLVIDEFVFDASNTATRVVVNALKGVFRFISGNSPSSAYQVNLPTMSIGVRGTAFDGHAAVPSQVLTHLGQLLACEGDDCDILEGTCRIFESLPAGGVGTPGSLEQQRIMFAYFNTLISNQFRFDEPFRVETNRCVRPNPRLFQRPRRNDDPTISPPPPMDDEEYEYEGEG